MMLQMRLHLSCVAIVLNDQDVTERLLRQAYRFESPRAAAEMPLNIGGRHSRAPVAEAHGQTRQAAALTSSRQGRRDTT
jgi:hypothetical protein